MLKSIFGVLPVNLENQLFDQFPAYRKQQLFSWLYKHYCNDLDGMQNLPALFKQTLREHYSFTLPITETKLVSRDGSIKYRLKLSDGALIESVLIPEEKKRTLCISSQVGCSRDCSFCSTGKMKLLRNLETHEIVSQIVLASKELKFNDVKDTRLTNLVLMGMGEPLDNLDSVFEAIRLIQDPLTLSFSPRRTTISTCGIIPGIIRMADSGIKAKLALSLNSAIDEKRSNIMPVNRIYPLNELKQALLYFRRKSNFRITLEYILIPGFNMDSEDIKALRKFVGDISCKVNFIPYNPGPDAKFKAPTSQQIEDFLKKAQSLSQAITLRKSRGADVFGACGQLSVTAQKEK